MKRVAALALGFLVACTPHFVAKSPDRPVDCKLVPERSEFHADTAFLPSEREAIARAVGNMRALSKGNIALSVVYDVDFMSTPSVVANAFRPMLIRRLSWMHPVIAIDMHFKAHVLGWTTYEPFPRVQVIVDRLAAEGALEWVTTHELGHAIGFKGGFDSQDHTADPRSVMAPHYDGQSAWTDDDLAACRAACLCP